MSIKIRTGDLARELGIRTTKVTLYTKLGLFKPSGRSDGGRYLYDFAENKQRFQVITKLQDKHKTLSEIKEHLDSGQTEFSLGKTK